MKLIRTGLVAAAVGALMTLPLAAAHAAPAAQTLKVTSLTGAGNQGWGIDDNGVNGDAYPYEFVAGNTPPIGDGSLQFVASDPTINAEKMFVRREANIPASQFEKVAFDYRFSPTSLVKTPAQFYINLYVTTVTPQPIRTRPWYDCKFDYVATATADGTWSTVTALPGTPATATPANPVGCPTTITGLNPADKIFLIALNAGDTGSGDAGIKGGIDKAVVQTTNSNITYDFDPGPACTQANLPVITGTTRNDLKNGTEAAEKIDLLAGNDSSDAKGGADCVLGGDGNDQLKGGAGDDEIQSGAGNDSVDAGAGKDVVDAGAGNDLVSVKDGAVDTVNCGAGNDIAIADSTDVLTGCEIRR